MIDTFKRKSGWPLRQQFIEWGLSPCIEENCRVLLNREVLAHKLCARCRAARRRRDR